MKNNSKKPAFRILAVLFCLNILSWIVVYQVSEPRFLEVIFFDVGQGDAIFIVSPQGHQILIDGGPDPTILEKLNREMPFYDRSIDLIILTHPEHDHITGLIEVLKKYKVENILWNGVIRDTAEYDEWKRLIKAEGARIFIGSASQKISCKVSNNTLIPPKVSASPDLLEMEILYPFESLEGQKLRDSNNTSIVARLVFGENSFLFTGDVHKSVEKQLIEGNTNVSSDVLKIAHHGSKTSSAQDFIEKVSPAIAVIQCGKNNSYGHPHQETLEILKKYDIQVLRTDLQGDIEIISDGRHFEVKNQNTL